MIYNIEINQRAGKRVDKRWLRKIVAQTLKAVGVKNAEISIAFVGDKKMKALNKKWRERDKVTDVLSFVYEKKPLAGEVIICYPQAVRQSRERGYGGVEEEIKTLVIHGLLHLCGYEHEGSLKEARRMERLQSRVLKLIETYRNYV